jgi:putative transposase
MCSEQRVIRQAYRFELDPNRPQRVLLAKSVGASRYVYNWGLAESQRVRERTGKRPPLGDLKFQLVKLKKNECPWLYEVSAHIGQSALKDLDGAFERFFKSLRGEGSKSGFPKFKRKGERDSARLYEIELSERHIRLPKIGQVRSRRCAPSAASRGAFSRQRLLVALIAGSAHLPLSAKGKSSCRSQSRDRAMSLGSISG